MARIKDSQSSIMEANRTRVEFSEHGDSMGAAGVKQENERPGEFLSEPGDMTVVNPHEHGFEKIRIAMSWDNVAGKLAEKKHKKASPLKKMAAIMKAQKEGVDLDLGCLYELKNGQRGAVQAFGNIFGSFSEPPYIDLSGDERTGDAPGDDEYFVVNGAKWPEIKRMLLYVYIYSGVPDWSSVRPEITIRVPGEAPVTFIPAISDQHLAVCAFASLENVRDGIKLTNHTEFFPGHAEMDRAFGYGIHWADGTKD